MEGVHQTKPNQETIKVNKLFRFLPGQVSKLQDSMVDPLHFCPPFSDSNSTNLLLVPRPHVLLQGDQDDHLQSTVK